MRKLKKITTGIFIKPIITSDFDDRGQVDLVDFQSLPDGIYKFAMHEGHLSKYNLLRPLTIKRAAEVVQ